MRHGTLSGLVWGSIISVGVLSVMSLLAPLPETVSPPANEVGAETPQDDPVLTKDATGIRTDATPGPVAEPAEISDDSAEPHRDAPVRPAVVPLEAPAADRAPQPVDPVGDPPATDAARTGVASTIEIPAGSEFRRALPDAGAAVPARDTAPPSVPAPDIAQPQPLDPSLALPDTAGASRPEALGEAAPAPVAPDVVEDSPSDPATGSPLPAATAPAGHTGTRVTEPSGGRFAPDASPLPQIGTTTFGGQVQQTTDPAPAEEDAKPPVATDPAVQEPQTSGPRSDFPAADTPAASEAELQDLTGPIRPEGDEASDLALLAGTSANVRVRRLIEETGTPSRLPQIGARRFEDTAEESGPDRVLRRHAVPFPNDAGRPLLAVVLIATPDEAIPADIGVPLTVALDPNRDGIAGTAAALRAAGHEVVILATGLPEGAVPQDVEVSLAADLAAVPGAVAVMDPPQDGMGHRRALAVQAKSILAAEGYGIIGWGRGLDPFRSLSAGDQPVALIKRQIDADGAAPEEIERALDRAALEAAQSGAEVVVGHARPETLRALADWSGSDRAGQVSLSPVSAVLLAR